MALKWREKTEREGEVEHRGRQRAPGRQRNVEYETAKRLTREQWKELEMVTNKRDVASNETKDRQTITLRRSTN